MNSEESGLFEECFFCGNDISALDDYLAGYVSREELPFIQFDEKDAFLDLVHTKVSTLFTPLGEKCKESIRCNKGDDVNNRKMKLVVLGGVEEESTDTEEYINVFIPKGAMSFSYNNGICSYLFTCEDVILDN